MKKLKNKILFNYIGNLITQAKSNIMKRTINILLLASVITTSMVNAGWQDDMWNYYSSAKNSTLVALKSLDEAGIINEADTTKALSNLNREQDLDGTLTAFITENIITEVKVEPMINAQAQELNDLNVNEVTVKFPIEPIQVPAEVSDKVVKNWFGNNWDNAVSGTKESINSVATFAKENPLRIGALVAGTAGVVAGGVAVYKNRDEINAKYPKLFKYAGVTALATAAVVALQCKTGMFDKIIGALPMSAALATAATATTAGATTGLAVH